MRSNCCLSACLTLLATVILPTASLGAGFAAGISPSKFELRAKPGEVLRDTITITNPASTPSDYQLRTADWRLNDERGVEFVEDTLIDGSCRPWVRLERRVLQVRPGEQKRYRFEVHVPAEAPVGLCRFAILIEPVEPAIVRVGDSEMSFPVVGRFAVITYVTIGDARADVEYLGLGAAQIVNEQHLPTLKLRNTGNTYDRAFGQIIATDGSNRRVALIPSDFPVLPGRTEEILLSPETPPEGQEPVRFVYPLALSGSIEIGGETLRVLAVLE